MAVMLPKEIGLDRRVGALEHRVGALEKKVDDGFAEIKSEIRSRFDGVDERFDRMQNTLIGSAAVIVASLIGLIATQI